MVLLIGGCACVGKTTVAMTLARRFDVRHVGICEGLRDDVDVSPFRGPEPWQRSARALCGRLVAKGAALEPNIRRLVLEHRDGAVIEGEGIDPALAATLASHCATKAVFIVELAADQVRANMEQKSSSFRMLAADRQAKVIAMCSLYNQWIRQQAENKGQAWLRSRPWASLADRIAAAIAQPSAARVGISRPARARRLGDIVRAAATPPTSRGRT